MIPVQDIIKLIRFKQQDNNEVKFSDYDIIQSLNECLRYVNQSYAMQNSDFLEKVITIDEDDINQAINADNLKNGTSNPYIDLSVDGTNLPDDFLTIVSVIRDLDGPPMSPCEAVKRPLFWQYKIIGGKIYVGWHCVTVLYRSSIDGVSADSSIALPTFFKDSIVKITGMILSNNADGDTMMQMVNETVADLVPRRRYSNVKTRMPFYC
jgi:hypothetical protein